MKLKEEVLLDETMMNCSQQSNCLQYWGPVGHKFSDSFLTMTNDFLQKYFENESVKKIKGIFSSIVELVQNVADYNEIRFSNGFPNSLIGVKVLESKVMIFTKNKLDSEDVKMLDTLFEKITSLSGTVLESEHKNAILNGKSLGLLMIQRLDESKFDYKIETDQAKESWLHLQLAINYGSTTN